MSGLHTLLAVYVTFIWGINFTFMTWGLASFPPFMLTALRFFLVAVPLIFFVERPKFNASFLTYVISMFVLQYGLLFTAMSFGAPAGLTSLILQVQIFLTVLLAYVQFSEPVSKLQLLGMIVGMLGLGLIAVHLEAAMPLLAFVLILLAAVSCGFGNIASKMNHTSALSLVSWGGLLASLPLALMSMATETHAWQVTTVMQASMKTWFAIGIMVYGSTLSGFALWAYLLRQNSAAKVMPFALLIPVFGMSTSVILNGEQLTWWKLVAMALILMGLVLSNIKPAKTYVKTVAR